MTWRVRKISELAWWRLVDAAGFAATAPVRTHWPVGARSSPLAFLAACLGAALSPAGGQTSAPGSTSDPARLAYGRHLASECSSCHRIDGVDNGIPSITGWPVEGFVETMGYYKTGARPNQVMVSVAKSLDDEQLAALAAYYGSLPKRARSK